MHDVNINGFIYLSGQSREEILIKFTYLILPGYLCQTLPQKLDLATSFSWPLEFPGRLNELAIDMVCWHRLRQYLAFLLCEVTSELPVLPLPSNLPRTHYLVEIVSQ